MRATLIYVSQNRSDFDDLTRALPVEPLRTLHAHSYNEALDLARSHAPELVCTDLALDMRDGIELATELRQLPETEHTYIAVLSHRAENYVEVTALNAGADDYLIKPVNKRVLESRVRAWLRRLAIQGQLDQHRTSVNDVMLCDDNFTLTVQGKEIILQRKEFEIISLLFSRPRKVFSRNEIRLAVWGENDEVRNRTIDVHIRNLRFKIGARYIKTYKGIGYSFEA